jgi:hypothetical protein
VPFELAQVAKAFGNDIVVAAHPLGQNVQQVFLKRVRCIDHLPENALVDYEQVRLFGRHNVSRRISVFYNRHLADAGADVDGREYRRIRRADVNIEPPGQDQEYVFVFDAGREQQFSGTDVAPFTALQQILYVVGIDAMKQLEPGKQRALVV